MKLRLKLIIGFTTLSAWISQSFADASFTTLDTNEELATHMVELQVLTHKLGLSVDAENVLLIKFYLHESLVKIEEIQTKLPEYEGSPVAVYIDRLSKPTYASLNRSLELLEAERSDFEPIKSSYLGIINSCNLCHVSSGRSEIIIKHNSLNPYLQDFSVQKK